MPSWSTLSEYYAQYDLIESKTKDKVQLNVLSWLSRFLGKPIFKKGSLLLDVGCGEGALLERNFALGLEVFGVEPDKAKAEMCLNKKLKVFCGKLEDYNPEIKFDIITFANVFEHIPNPHEILDKCKQVLSKKGLLIIQVPNASSFLARTFKDNCQLFAVPYHLINYSKDNLSELLTKHGFAVIGCRNIPGPFSYVESLSLKYYGREGQIQGRKRLIAVATGLIFESVAYVLRESAFIEIIAVVNE
jgi:SAM-dependent methyltransferase